MNTELKAKFLQHLVSKNNDEGFSLIELLTVIVIIGILASLALPAFLSQAAKARFSEAKQTVGAINRAQQAYRLEKSAFAASFEELEVGLPSATQNYTYTLTGSQDSAVILAEPGDTPLRSASGRVEVTSKGLTTAGACQSIDNDSAAAVPTYDESDELIVCPPSMEPMR